jgi:hypothetical protein
MSTVTITVEIQDNTSASEVEKIVENALSENGVDCIISLQE